MLRSAVVACLLVRVASADDAPDVRAASTDAEPPDDAEVIEVTGTAPRAPEKIKLEPELLHTMPGAGNDALRGLTSLPGVARVPFGMGGLALRGAAPHDTRVFLDGIEVPILYHFAERRRERHRLITEAFDAVPRDVVPVA